MTKDEVKELLTFLSELYPTLELTESLVAAWRFALGNQDSKLLFAAVQATVQRPGSFPPTPGDLIALAEELDPDRERTAEEAWDHKPYRGPFTTLEKFTWREWGGRKRYDELPDPRYVDNAGYAQGQRERARKEFIEIHHKMKERRRVNRALKHREQLENEANKKIQDGRQTELLHSAS